MGGLSQALSIALSGLQTSTSLISMTSNNISNANTVGYTTKSANITSNDFGSNFGGVEITSYARAADQALTTDYNNATSAAGYASTQNDYMKQIQTILASTASNPTLSSDVANFAAAWNNYAAQPESSSQEENVISTAQTLANDINIAASRVGTLKAQIISDTSDNITTLNADLRQVASLNKSIQDATSAGLQTVDLHDQLDGLVTQISSFMNVSVQSRPNGQIALYTPSGQLLVDSQVPKQFSFNGAKIFDSSGTDVTSAFSGGSLQAATDFIDSSTAAATSAVPGVGVIAKFQAQLSVLVGAFTSTTNPNGFAAQYNAAVTASTATGAPQAGATLASSVFTVTNNGSGNPDPSTFAVTANLAAGTAGLPQTNAQNIANTFNQVANYSTSGLSAQSATYTQLATTILSTFQQTANTISTQSTTATSQQTYYQTSLSNKTGVNTDTELANLVTYQNSYAASAHVISTVNQMLSTLMSVLQ